MVRGLGTVSESVQRAQPRHCLNSVHNFGGFSTLNEGSVLMLKFSVLPRKWTYSGTLPPSVGYSVVPENIMHGYLRPDCLQKPGCFRATIPVSGYISGTVNELAMLSTKLSYLIEVKKTIVGNVNQVAAYGQKEKSVEGAGQRLSTLCQFDMMKNMVFGVLAGLRLVAKVFSLLPDMQIQTSLSYLSGKMNLRENFTCTTSFGKV